MQKLSVNVNYTCCFLDPSLLTFPRLPDLHSEKTAPKELSPTHFPTISPPLSVTPAQLTKLAPTLSLGGSVSDQAQIRPLSLLRVARPLGIVPPLPRSRRSWLQVGQRATAPVASPLRERRDSEVSLQVSWNLGEEGGL